MLVSGRVAPKKIKKAIFPKGKDCLPTTIFRGHLLNFGDVKARKLPVLNGANHQIHANDITTSWKGSAARKVEAPRAGLTETQHKGLVRKWMMTLFIFLIMFRVSESREKE